MKHPEDDPNEEQCGHVREVGRTIYSCIRADRHRGLHSFEESPMRERIALEVGLEAEYQERLDAIRRDFNRKQDALEGHQ